MWREDCSILSDSPPKNSTIGDLRDQQAIIGEVRDSGDKSKRRRRVRTVAIEAHRTSASLHRRRLHRGSGIFAPVLVKEPRQTTQFAPVLFGT